MDPRIVPLAEIFRLNTRLLGNCLDGLTEEQAAHRTTRTSNSASFIAAHVADSRWFILRLLGDTSTSPLAPYLEGRRTIDDCERLPTLEETLAAWRLSDELLAACLESLSPAEVDAPLTTRLPVAEQRMSSALAFFAQHDSYHVGQLALLRREAGLPAMKYR